MGEALTVAIVGIGGYGNNYVAPLLDGGDAHGARIVGAIDPNPSACRRLAELQALGVPIVPTLEMFCEKHRADLTVISTPLHLHAQQTCHALSCGSHVLCEKPLCVTPEQARQMIEARDAAGKFVAVGYQWSYSSAIQRLKADVMSGVLGKAKRLRTLVLWPRDEIYYRRNRWAGAVSNGRDLILDSPVNNACAHYLHNAFYVLGPRVDASAEPATLTAELYRAHPIQNYDTAALRCRTSCGAEVLFTASHATASKRGPIFRYEFERAVVDYADNRPGATIVARFSDGTTKDYGSPNDGRDDKLWTTLDAIRGRADIPCGIEASMAHVRCTWAAQQSSPQINGFAASRIRTSGEVGSRRTWVEGLDDVLAQCYDRALLPSELGADWAHAARELAIDDACATGANVAAAGA